MDFFKNLRKKFFNFLTVLKTRVTEISEDDFTMLIDVILGRFEIRNCSADGFDCLKGRGA